MPDNTVPLATAQEEITNWKNYCIAKSLSDRVKAINIPLNSLIPILEMQGVSGVRAYIGLAEDTTMAGMHLFIVGVDSDGADIVEVNGKSAIYDLSLPCPNTCDSNSPLNI